MTRLRLTEDQIRTALAPDHDHPIAGLEDAIRAEIRTTPQLPAPHALGRWRPTLGPGGVGRPRTAVIGMALVMLLLLGALVLASASLLLSPQPAMFHGDAARTGIARGSMPPGLLAVTWSAQLRGPVQNGSPAIVGRDVVVADGSGRVWAFAADDAQARWVVEGLVKPVVGSVAVADGVVVVGAGDGIHAIDLQSGQPRWSYPTSAAVKGSPAIVDGWVVVGTMDGLALAIDLRTGAERWTTMLGAPVSRGPAVADAVAYFAQDDGEVAAVDLVTGVLRWEVPAGDGAIGTPAVSADHVLVVTGVDDPAAQHRLVALDPATGFEAWGFDPETGAEVYLGAAADGHVWLVGLDGLVRDIVDGAQLWSRDLGAPIGSPATIADGVLLVSAGDGTIHALELTTGTERWAVVVSGDPGPVSVADGRVALATSTGLLSLLGPSPNASP